MKSMEELKEKLCKELEDIARKPEMKAGDLEMVHKLTASIKNIDKMEMYDEYSEDGGMGRGGYSRESSYANRGKHYVRGHYSRDGGNYVDGASYARDRRGRYSRDEGYSRVEGKEYMMEQLEGMMQDASTEKEREAIRRCMSQIENA